MRLRRWVGGGDYFSQDSIEYFITWLKCQREAANTTVDFLGLWNEPHWRSDYWGGANYTKALRRQLNAAGFEATKLVLLDDAPQYSGPGGLPQDFVEAFSSDAEFREATEVVGYHYCCDPQGLQGYEALSVSAAAPFASSPEGRGSEAGCTGEQALPPPVGVRGPRRALGPGAGHELQQRAQDSRDRLVRNLVRL